MKAAICHAFGEPLTIEEVALRPPAAGEVEVTLDAVAICHSDISCAEGAWSGPLPAVYGHEAAGRVSALGAGVAGLSVGDTVLVTLIRHCGQCLPCAEGHPTRCETRVGPLDSPLSLPDGTPVAQGLQTGAFAERVVVDKSQVVPIPADLPMESACLLSCGVITGVGAVVNTAGLRPGAAVAVIGAGGVGLNVIQGARIAGARRIFAIDLADDKLQAAREFGATHGIRADMDRPHREVKRLNGGRGVDAVFVAVGAISAYEGASRYLARGGALVVVGMPPAGQTMALAPDIVAASSQRVLGSFMGEVLPRRDIPWLVELYRQGRLKLDELVSGRWRLEQINEAIADTLSGHARRNVILFS